MDPLKFVISISWLLIAALTLGFLAYLILTGKLKWIRYDSVIGKIGLAITESFGIKDLTADEILAFESFVYHDLQNMERGARLAYILLFMEKELLSGQFEDNVLHLDLTEKGKKIHAAIIEECEKRLMITPKTEIKWKAGEKKTLKTMEQKLVSRMNIH